MSAETSPPPADPPEEPLDPLDPDTPLGAGIDFTDPKSPLAPYYLKTAHVLAVTLFGLIAVFVAHRQLFHTDVWAHLAYGRWLAEHRNLPEHELLNPFTDKKSPLFFSMWLTQVGGYKCYEFGEKRVGGDAIHRMEGGVEAILTAFTLIVMLSLVGVTVAYVRVSGSIALSLFGCVFVVLFMSTLVSHRPQALGVLAFSWVLAGISRTVPSRRAMIWVPLVMMFWANTHGSFVVGLALISLVLLGRVIENWDPDGWHCLYRDDVVRRMIAILAISCVAVAVNPYGWDIYRHVLAFASNPNLQTFVEWSPLDFSEKMGGHIAYWIGLVPIVLLQWASRRPLTPTQLILLVFFGAWPLFQTRAMTWWLLLAPWLFLPQWSHWAYERNWILQQSIPSFRKTMLALLILVTFGMLISPARCLLQKNPRPLSMTLSKGTPFELGAILLGSVGKPTSRTEAVQKAVAERFAGRPVGAIFASESLGDYLVWAAPEKPVMLFTHGEKFTRDYWQACMNVKGAIPGWWEFLDLHRVNVLVLEPDLHAELIKKIRSSTQWDVVLDESDQNYLDPMYSRHFVAIRKRPYLEEAR